MNRKRLAALVNLIIVAALAISAAEPRVSRTFLAGAEKSLDGRIVGLWNDQLALVGPTRGLYLDGFGVVLTAEVNLATPPISLMNPTLSGKQLTEMHGKKKARLPVVRAAMKSALMEVADSMAALPANEQVVIAFLFPRYPGEPGGLPIQLIMQASKQQLLEAKRAAGSGADSAIRVIEY
jgi:hypothetical protein